MGTIRWRTRFRRPLVFILLFLAPALLSCAKESGRGEPPSGPIASEAPRAGDYRRDEIARLKSRTSDPAALPSGTLPAIEVTPLAGGETLSLLTLARPGTVTALVFYVPNERSRSALTLLRWFQASGASLQPIFVDLGADSAVSSDFARRYAEPLPVYRANGIPSWTACGISDSSSQLPVVHFIRDSPAAYAVEAKQFEAEVFLSRLEMPDLLGSSIASLRARLAQAANQPGAALLALYFNLWDGGLGAQAHFIAGQVPRVRRRDPLAMLVWANAYQSSKRDEVKAFLDNLKEETLTGIARGMRHYVLGKTAYSARDYPAAAEHFTAAIAAGMGDQERRAHYQIAQSLRLSRRKSEAVAAFRKAIAMGFENVDCYHFLGEIIDNDPDKTEALDVYDKALRFSPWAGELHWHRGQALHAMGRHEDATGAWLKGAALEDNYPRNFEEAGNCLLWHLKRKDDAYAILKEGVRIRGSGAENRRTANLWNNLGVAAFQRNERELAIACYLEAIRIQEDHPYAYGNLGEAYEAIGRPGSALWSYESGIERTPESPRLAAMQAGRTRVQSGAPPPAAPASATSESETSPRDGTPSRDEPPVRDAP